MKTIAKVILIVIAVLSILCFWMMFSSPISDADISKLKKGMTKEQVVNALGNPDKVHDDTTWRYGSSLQWNFFLVEFDENEKVITFALDD